MSGEHRPITFDPISAGATFADNTFPDWPQATPDALAALIGTFRSGHWWQSGGGACERFEAWLASRHGVDHAVGVANGTVALEIALRAVGVCAGDDVLVPALTFISTASAVSAVGARPIPVDVERGSLCLSIDDALQKRTERTTAVIAVHLAGQPAHMPRARTFASAHGLALIEDAAQAVCAEWMGTRVGGFGDAATFSFHATKLLAGGEGGAIVTRDAATAQRCRLLANCGRDRGSRSYDHEVPGTNGRMSEFHAAILLAATAALDSQWRQRTTMAERLTEELGHESGIDPPAVLPEVTRMSWYMYCVRPAPGQADRSNVESAAVAGAIGLPVMRMYPPFHELPAYATSCAPFRGTCPEAELAGREVVCVAHRVLLAEPQFAASIAAALAASLGLTR